MTEQIQIHNGYHWNSDISGLWIVKYVWNEEHTKIIRQYALFNGEWVERKEGEEMPFSVEFKANDSHIFNEAIEKFKKINANYENRDKEIDALKEHLSDMRRIVFKPIGVNNANKA